MPTTFADSADIEIDSKQIALSGSMPRIPKEAASIEQAEFAMQQEMIWQNTNTIDHQHQRQADTR